MSEEHNTAPTDRTVLVTDDDATMRRIIRRALEKDGWAVEEADHGVAACAAVERRRPALVLLDVEMPKLNGFDTCTRLRTLPGCGQLPILMITGRDDKESIAAAFKAGATDFLSKPFDYTVLRQRVQYMYRASQAMGDLQTERDFVSATFDASAALVLSLDREGRILRFNPSCERASGLSLQDVQHKYWWDIFTNAEESERERLMFERLVSERRTRHDEGSWTATDGTRREIAWSNAVCVGLDGELEQVVCTGLDITERNQAQDEVRFLASYDPLTGLPNRRLMLERMDQAIAAADADGQQLAVLLLDLDRFTHVNATVGHAVGDLLLRDVSQRLSKSLRLSDVLARHGRELRTELGRIGGHEFTVLLTGVSQPKEVVGVIERLQRGLDRPFRYEEREYALTASVGATLYPSDGTDAENLLRNAESAVDAARQQRPGSYHFFSASMRTSIAHRLSLESELRYAIARGELVLHYQPKVGAATRGLVGAEALVRWQHPDRGLVPPAEFIDIAEETGLILPIGEWVLREACTQVMDWLELGLRPVPVAVNLSSAQFHLEDLLGQTVSVLNDTGMDPHYLGIEVTESMIMRDADEAHAILDRLKSLGVRVAIDDFGTGYSALSAIRTLPFHDLKIDRVFIKDIATSGEDLAITRAIITMAHGLGLSVVAEGVESEEQLTLLRREGCDEVQGFLISPGVPSEQFTAMLHGRGLDSSSAAPSLAEPGSTETSELVSAFDSTMVKDPERRSP